MNIRPVVGWNVKVNGLRRPRAQIARLSPVVWLKNGLSVGIEPSLLIRRSLPRGLASVWEFELTAFSPTAM